MPLHLSPGNPHTTEAHVGVLILIPHRVQKKLLPEVASGNEGVAIMGQEREEE